MEHMNTTNGMSNGNHNSTEKMSENNKHNGNNEYVYGTAVDAEGMNGSHTKMNHDEKFMDMKEVYAEMNKDLSEEIHDTKKYLKMSKSAEMSGNEKLAKYLHAIAKDEYTHATFLYDYLSESGMDVSEEDERHYESLKKIAEHKFR